MQAMVLSAFGQPLALREVPTPAPGAAEVLVRVRACGLCGSDLKIAGGKISTAPLPHILGHEIAGEVVQCGEGASEEWMQKRVIAHIYNSCGNCGACKNGSYNLCQSLQGRLGFELPGGLAQYICVQARNLVPVPDNVDDVQACIVPCAMLAIYHAIQRANISHNDHVVMLGVGGLGIHGIQFLSGMGVDVTAVDISPEKRVFARKFGAFSTMSYDDFICNNGKYTVILDNVAKPSVAAACMKKLGKNGRYIMVGYAPGVEFPFDSEYMHLNETQIVGTRNGTMQELSEILRLLSSNAVQSIVDRVLPLHRTNEALELVREGNAVGRVVLSVDNA